MLEFFPCCCCCIFLLLLLPLLLLLVVVVVVLDDEGGVVITLAAFRNKCQHAARCPPLITSHQWIISLCWAIFALPIGVVFSKRKKPNGSSGAIRSWW